MMGARVQVINRGAQAAGAHRLEVNLDGLGAGMYLIRMNIDGEVVTQRLNVLR
jgi:hypothetical protein